MKQKFVRREENQEPGETQLVALIKQAGDDARTRRKKTLAQHFNRLRVAVAEAVSNQQDPSET